MKATDHVHPISQAYATFYAGMRVRDYIAMQALVGMLAAQAHEQSSGVIPVNAAGADEYAKAAYVYADALIRASVF